MKVLLSIKPEFADLIFNGEKKYEFRRTIFKNQGIKTIIIYVSSPVQRVVGEIEIESVLNHDLDTLWQITKEFSGIQKSFFYKYFKEKRMGYALKIRKTKKYKVPLSLYENYGVTPPQSFRYLT